MALLAACTSQVCADWITTTSETKQEAEMLQSHLREQFGKKIEFVHLADVATICWREGRIEEKQEVRMTVDSEGSFHDLRAALEAVHPEDLPMIVSAAAAGGTLLANKGQSDQYYMAAVELNETKADDVGDLAKEIVELRYAGCAQVEDIPEQKDTFRMVLKTTRAMRQHIIREFGGLSFQWTSLRGNRRYLDWLDTVAQGNPSEL